MNTPLTRLRHHVTRAIERGEKTAIAEIPAFKIMKDVDGHRAVKILSTGKIIPADLAGLCTGKDHWLSLIECKCRDCGQSVPLSALHGGGQWCEPCQTKDMVEEESAA